MKKETEATEQIEAETKQLCKGIASVVKELLL
jgi:hypothetical protein